MSVGGGEDEGGGVVALEVAVAEEEEEEWISAWTSAWISAWISRRKDASSASACSSRVRARGGSAMSSRGEGGDWDGAMVWLVSLCVGTGVE